MTRRSSLAFTISLALAAAGFAAAAQDHGAAPPSGHGAPSAPSAEKNPYGAYSFLIGEWNVAPEAGGAPLGVMRFKWGPNRSYVWISMSMLQDGKEEPHFEGLLVWNGVKKNLDMLLAVDLSNGLVQEQGTVSVSEDGTVVREITMLGGERAGGRPGTTAHFRQTFKATAPDRVLTNAMRKTEKGWTATFPGSDKLVMTRRA